jgi:hypothetical protein
MRAIRNMQIASPNFIRRQRSLEVRSQHLSIKVFGFRRSRARRKSALQHGPEFPIVIARIHPFSFT